MMCEHEFESLRTADGSFCMTACRKCMKSTGEIETFCKAENRIAAANARVAELESAGHEAVRRMEMVSDLLNMNPALHKLKAALEEKP